MSKQVWKFPIGLQKTTNVEMPFGAKILFAAVQHGDICVWAEVDPKEKPLMRTLRIYGTGHEMPDDAGRYIGTVMIYNGDEVYHIYE